MKQFVGVARIYCRVSTDDQIVERQTSLVETAREQGLYVAGVYKEVASGTTLDRPELQRLLGDLQPGDVIVAEHIDRISRVPLAEAEELVTVIKEKGARLCVPGIVDFSQVITGADSMTDIVVNATQELLLKIALFQAREDYEVRRRRQLEGIELAKKKGLFKGRQANLEQHQEILTVRSKGYSIKDSSKIVGCSEAQIKRVCKLYRDSNN